MSEIIRLPLHLLSITATNARRDHVADKAMIASLKSQGLLYPLLVQGIDGSESYDVVDGARRLSCILKGLENEDLAMKDWESVPCILSNGDARSSGLEQSLHANLHQAMHPLDECEAILKLAEDEEDKAAIALRFGQDEKWLDQRVKLAQLIDEVKELFRSGEISLSAAMAFTLGTPAQQKAFLKAHKRDGFSTRDIAPAMTEKAINAKWVNFPLEQYTGPTNRDLFGDDVWLLDRQMVGELQDVWLQGEIQALKNEGYDKVECLPRDDWQTLQNTVEVTGKISAAVKATLACYFQVDHYGTIVVHKNRISRKKVDDKGKIKKKKESADETAAENVKPLVCTDLSPAQQEIINAYAASELYTQVIEGNELLAKFMVVDQMFGQGCWTEGRHAHRHNGTISRWERLNKDYPAENIINGSEIEAIGQLEPKELTFEVWKGLSFKTREQLFYRACAAMIFVPYAQRTLKPDLPELGKADWLQPCGDFFKRFRTDQLIDYRKRSGDKEAGATAKKKEAHVTDCVVVAATPKGFRFGLYGKKARP
jgi:ParB-like chromosome segregation protein Spo0J